MSMPVQRFQGSLVELAMSARDQRKPIPTAASLAQAAPVWTSRLEMNQ